VLFCCLWHKNAFLFTTFDAVFDTCLIPLFILTTWVKFVLIYFRTRHLPDKHYPIVNNGISKHSVHLFELFNQINKIKTLHETNIFNIIFDNLHI
jgi:hypothetical protein